MSQRELAAAGIFDPLMRQSYEACRQLNAEHGKTYYLATLLLPPAKRPAVHALYGFARYADEIVDDLDSALTEAEKAAHLHQWGEQFLHDLEAGESDHRICRAVVDTALRWNIPREHFEAFLESMAMDLTVTEYADFAALSDYMYGSAAVIGLQMLPILSPTSVDAHDYAVDLAFAFQLANFIRDVDEDLTRGRLYLPIADLAQFGLTREDLEHRVVTEPVRQLLQFEIARVRRLDQASRPGIALLAPEVQPCINAARVMYCGIVDAIERIDYQVFTERASVSVPRRAQVAIPAWLHAVKARHAL